MRKGKIRQEGVLMCITSVLWRWGALWGGGVGSRVERVGIAVGGWTKACKGLAGVFFCFSPWGHFLLYFVAFFSTGPYLTMIYKMATVDPRAPFPSFSRRPNYQGFFKKG